MTTFSWQQVSGLVPFIIIFVFAIVYLRGVKHRQVSTMQVGRENTAAVQENTAALKALLAKLESQSKP